VAGELEISPHPRPVLIEAGFYSSFSLIGRDVEMLLSGCVPRTGAGDIRIECCHFHVQEMFRYGFRFHYKWLQDT
jgi:hypothetical protein